MMNELLKNSFIVIDCDGDVANCGMSREEAQKDAAERNTGDYPYKPYLACELVPVPMPLPDAPGSVVRVGGEVFVLRPSVAGHGLWMNIATGGQRPPGRLVELGPVTVLFDAASIKGGDDE